MSFNGSGVFNRLYNWVNDAANGIKIRADRMDNEMNGMATGLTTCLTRDGQSPATANLPMGGFKHQNAAAGTAAGDYLVYGQALNGASLALIGGSLVAGQTVVSQSQVTATGNPAINNLMGALAAYVRNLIFLTWNGGSGWALCVIAADGSIVTIASNNAKGGDNCFDNINDVNSNGGNGVALIYSGGFVFIQTKVNYAGGVITLHRYGG